MDRRFRYLFLSLLPALVSGCGSGTFGIFAASDSSSGSSNAATVGSDLEVKNVTGDARPAQSPAYVSFLLTDEEGDAADTDTVRRVAFLIRQQEADRGGRLPGTLIATVRDLQFDTRETRNPQEVA